jgi:hypothetical protein
VPLFAIETARNLLLVTNPLSGGVAQLDRKRFDAWPEYDTMQLLSKGMQQRNVYN